MEDLERPAGPGLTDQTRPGRLPDAAHRAELVAKRLFDLHSLGLVSIGGVEDGYGHFPLTVAGPAGGAVVAFDPAFNLGRFANIDNLI